MTTHACRGVQVTALAEVIQHGEHAADAVGALARCEGVLFDDAARMKGAKWWVRDVRKSVKMLTNALLAKQVPK
jgi:hypothetical protein